MRGASTHSTLSRESVSTTRKSSSNGFPLARREPSAERATAVTIEDELVVASYLIDVDERNSVFPDQASKHPETQIFLAQVIGRRGDIQHRARAVLNEPGYRIGPVVALGPEVPVVPDILADRKAELAATKVYWDRILGRLEIPILIEDVVSREEGLTNPRNGLPFVEECGGVENRFAGRAGVLLGVADERGRLAHSGG